MRHLLPQQAALEITKPVFLGNNMIIIGNKMSGIKAEVVADSISEFGDRLTTMQITVHRYVWAEFMTHRVFSRNASSSRAIPVSKILKQVWLNPAIPILWGSNKPGMQAGDELDGFSKKLAEFVWRLSAKVACCFVYILMKVGLHKQWANRILEPWLFITAIVSATEWDNFFALRIHPAALPEFSELAFKMKQVRDESIPKILKEGEWHLPYIRECDNKFLDLEVLTSISAARCCRVSYLNHENKNSSLEDDINLCSKLKSAKPIHASPFEHSATPMKGKHGNFTGWKQQRQFIEEGRYAGVYNANQ